MQVRKNEREHDMRASERGMEAHGKPLNVRLRQLDAKANAEKFRVTMMKLATL